MTASTPCRSPCSSYIVGIPPPPAQITICPARPDCGSAESRRSAWALGWRRLGGTCRRRRAMVQPLAASEALGGFPVVDRADRLGGVVERGVVAVDLDHRQQGGELLLGRQQVAEFLFDDVADHRLGLGAEHVERVRAATSW